MATATHMSLAASNGILRADSLGGSEPATLLWSEASRGYHRGSAGDNDPTMCVRNVRAGANPTNKRPAYEADEQQDALLYRHDRTPAEDRNCDGGRESKFRRLSPPFPAEAEQQGGGSAAAPWPSQQHVSQQQNYQQAPLIENTDPLAGGATDNPRLKRNKPVKWSAEEDRRLREAVVRVSERSLAYRSCLQPLL